MSGKIFHVSIWIATFTILVLITLQGWTGGWSVFYLVWPGSNVSATIVQVTASLAAYHVHMGFGIGVVSILVILLAFLAKSSVYVRLFSILGFGIVVLAALGGFNFVTTAFADRLSLGQMADAFIGAYIAYFLQLFFLNKTPRFPWVHPKTG
jgi:hypothetical protein